MLELFVQMPGASSEEISQRVSLPMEKLLREVPGVEYFYSVSQPGTSMLIVRFYAGSKEEDAIIQTYNKLFSNFDRIPPRSLAADHQGPLHQSCPDHGCSRCGARTMTRIPCDALPVNSRTLSSSWMTFPKPRLSGVSPVRCEWFWTTQPPKDTLYIALRCCRILWKSNNLCFQDDQNTTSCAPSGVCSCCA